MLRVVYEAVDSIEGGKLADISEQRGGTRVRVARGQDVQGYARALNEEMSRFLDQSSWFQLWRDEVISRSGGTIQLDVIFTIHDLPPGAFVAIQESKGLVDIRIERSATVDQFVASANPTIKQFLAGKQWFQLWEGEIVDMDSH
jgi:hypothetical protein